MSKRKRIGEAKQEKRTEEEALSCVENTLTRDTVEVALDSLEANIGYGSLLRELHQAYLERVAFYRSKTGGSLSLEKARVI